MLNHNFSVKVVCPITGKSESVWLYTKDSYSSNPLYRCNGCDRCSAEPECIKCISDNEKLHGGYIGSEESRIMKQFYDSFQ